MKVLFITERGTENSSYLPVFTQYLAKNPQFGVEPELLMVGDGGACSDAETPFFRRLGFDGHISRLCRKLSEEVQTALESRKGMFGGIVVHSQAAGMNLENADCPIHVCVNATFQQLGRSAWFSEFAVARRFAGLVLGDLIMRERELYSRAATILPWSEAVATSLRTEYGISDEKMMRMPPSVEIGPERRMQWSTPPRGLFICEDFKRQGGDLVMDCFHQYFAGHIELDILTEEKLRPQAGVGVFRDLHEGSPGWRALWEESNFFLFPSRLEVFGTPLVRALAFGTPVIATKVGAAEEILEGGGAGLLMNGWSVDTLASSIETLLGDRRATIERVHAGRSRVESEYDLRRNSARLATALKGARSRAVTPAKPVARLREGG